MRFRLLANRQQAQDVMQETNLVLWCTADQFQPGTNFAAWMMKVAYYQVLDHRRKLNKQAIYRARTSLNENVIASPFSNSGK